LLSRLLARLTGEDPLDWAISGGEDYVLLFTVPPVRESEMLELCSRLLDLRPFVRPPGEIAKQLIQDLAAEPDLRPIMVDSEWTAYARTDFMRYPLPELGSLYLLR
jgi:hypothetical protein